jgi:hypothetical protein
MLYIITQKAKKIPPTPYPNLSHFNSPKVLCNGYNVQWKTQNLDEKEEAKVESKTLFFLLSYTLKFE